MNEEQTLLITYEEVEQIFRSLDKAESLLRQVCKRKALQQFNENDEISEDLNKFIKGD